jgi:hypothetical protein
VSHKRLSAQALGFSLVMLLLVACGTPQPAPTATSNPTLTDTPTISAPARVLFIGNSITFFNDLPEMFAELARSGGHEVEAAMSAEGGWTLSDHAASAMTLDKIEQGNWGFVVLQEQSAIPSIADRRSQEMYPAVRLLHERIEDSGADTILFMTWAHRDGLPGVGDCADMQAQLEAGYVDIATELDAMVAPVGIAWQHAVGQDPQLDLWQTDGLHPGREGTYLAACVFYAVIFLQSPEGLPYGAGLSEETAQFLQATANEALLRNPERWNIR